MIVKLRKRHFYTWAVLAVIIPIIIVSAYNSIAHVEPDYVAGNRMDAYKNMIAQSQGEFALINLRSEEGAYQIEAIILKPIQAANTTLQLSFNEKDIALGRLKSKGVYRFPIPQGVAVQQGVEVSIYDHIKNVEIEKISIQL